MRYNPAESGEGESQGCKGGRNLEGEAQGDRFLTAVEHKQERPQWRGKGKLSQHSHGERVQPSGVEKASEKT